MKLEYAEGAKDAVPTKAEALVALDDMDYFAKLHGIDPVGQRDTLRRFIESVQDAYEQTDRQADCCDLERLG